MSKIDLKTTNIKGKEYVEVNTRIAYFRENYPDGSIITEPVNDLAASGLAIFKASIIVNDKIRATGFAYEKAGSTFINKTSHIENCETSAIGRALGIFGIGIDGSVASAEEVQNAMANQVTKENILKRLDDLQKCYASTDFVEADRIKAWAEENNVAQVYDKHVALFAQK
jgi:hypothetical protein